MTPARIKALQWFHDRGEVDALDFTPHSAAPTNKMCSIMMCEGQLCSREDSDGWRYWSLTDKGRQDLHDATRR